MENQIAVPVCKGFEDAPKRLGEIFLASAKSMDYMLVACTLAYKAASAMNFGKDMSESQVLNGQLPCVLVLVSNVYSCWPSLRA